jgi:hypothetical protein
MIKFFRQIRQKLLTENLPDGQAGKFSKYLLYAIGEIILVVIGILIALQINNWNEHRKAEIAQKVLLENFLEDLKADATQLQGYQQTLTEYLATHLQIQQARKGMIKQDSITNPVNFRGSIRYHSIVLNNHPDIATKIMNEALRDDILNYYQKLSNLNNAYNQFHSVILEIVRPYLAANNLLNPDYLFNNPNQEGSSLVLEDFYKVIMTKEFGQILFEANLKANETKGIIELLLDENAKLCQSLKQAL